MPRKEHVPIKLSETTLQPGEVSSDSPGQINIHSDVSSPRGMAPIQILARQLTVSCPGCGKVSTIKMNEAPSYYELTGSLKPGGGAGFDEKTVTLNKPLSFDCCGWKGTLGAGEFHCNNVDEPPKDPNKDKGPAANYYKAKPASESQGAPTPKETMPSSNVKPAEISPNQAQPSAMEKAPEAPHPVHAPANLGAPPPGTLPPTDGDYVPEPARPTPGNDPAEPIPTSK